MSDHAYRNGRGGSRSRGSQYRSSRSPVRGELYRPSEGRQRSPTRARSGPGRRGRARYGGDHSDRGDRGERGRLPPVNRLPSDHPLVREIQELRRVRWNRLQDWIRLAQRLGSDWDHPRCPDYLEFRDEERMAGKRLEELAGAIALAERSLSFDQNTAREPSDFASKPQIPASRKRKHDEEPETWTRKKVENEVEAWMKSTKVKSLEGEKPMLPIVIGTSSSSGTSGDDLFLSDENNNMPNSASHVSGDNEGGSTRIASRPLTVGRAKTDVSAADTFSTTRDRADEFLEDLASGPFKKVLAKLPAPPIAPFPDVIEEPIKKIQPGLGRGSEHTSRTTHITENDQNAPEGQPADEDWTLEKFLRSLNNGNAEPTTSQQATEQHLAATVTGSRESVQKTQTQEAQQNVKQETVDVMELVRALNPQGKM